MSRKISPQLLSHTQPSAAVTQTLPVAVHKQTHTHTHIQTTQGAAAPCSLCFFPSLLSYQRKDERWNPIREPPGCRCLAFPSWLLAFFFVVVVVLFWVFFSPMSRWSPWDRGSDVFTLKSPSADHGDAETVHVQYCLVHYVFSKMRELIKTVHFEFSLLCFILLFIYLFVYFVLSRTCVIAPKQPAGVSAAAASAGAVWF